MAMRAMAMAMRATAMRGGELIAIAMMTKTVAAGMGVSEHNKVSSSILKEIVRVSKVILLSTSFSGFVYGLYTHTCRCPLLHTSGCPLYLRCVCRLYLSSTLRESRPYCVSSLNTQAILLLHLPACSYSTTKKEQGAFIRCVCTPPECGVIPLCN